MAELIPFLVAALALMGSPGPATLSLAGAGAAFGAPPLVRYWLGISCGTAGVLALVASGLTGLVLAVPGLAPLLLAAAAGYLVYLAWRIATAPPPGQGAGPRDVPGFLGGLALGLANPKAYAAIAAVFASSELVAGAPQVDALVKVAVLAPFIFGVNGAWLLLGARLGGVLRSPRLARLINRGFAALLLAAVALALLG